MFRKILTLLLAAFAFTAAYAPAAPAGAAGVQAPGLAAEPKAAEPKAAEPKAAEPKEAEPKEAGAAAGDDLASTAAERENPGLDAASITVRAKVPESWAEPCLWAWLDPDGTAAFPAWPGEPFVKDGDWYALQAPGWVNSVIVNANGGAVQTGDMKALEPGKDLWIVVTGAEDYVVDYMEIDAAAPAAKQEGPKREEPKRETARQEAPRQEAPQAAALQEAAQQAAPPQGAALQEAAPQEAAQQADPRQAAGTAARGGGNPVVRIIAVCMAAIAAIAVIAAVVRKKK